MSTLYRSSLSSTSGPLHPQDDVPPDAGRIGILAAVQEELTGLLALMSPGVRVHRIGMRDYHVGMLGSQPCVAVLARIGKVAAAASAVTLIREFGADTLILTGLAGGIGPDVNIGDIVVADGLIQHDMDASPLFQRYEVPLLGKSEFATDASLSDLLCRCAAEYLAQEPPAKDLAVFGIERPRVHRGLIASGDQFIGNAHIASTLRDALPGVLCVEMEGAAVAQICHEYGARCAVVRTISDRADASADIDFSAFLANVASRYCGGIFTRLAAHPVR